MGTVVMSRRAWVGGPLLINCCTRQSQNDVGAVKILVKVTVGSNRHKSRPAQQEARPAQQEAIGKELSTYLAIGRLRRNRPVGAHSAG